MGRLTFALRVAVACLLFAGAVRPADSQTAPSKTPGGTVKRITVHGKSLEGNLQSESADREVTVYLPPGYDTNLNRRYPVVYLLHGYGLTDQYWTGVGVRGLVGGIDLPAAMDRAIAGGSSREMILVMPNAYTSLGGSMYSSSVVIGDWESFVAEDLVMFVDSHYRTLANRMSRGLAGHSMGGYGTIRIGMKRPDVFSSLYMLSSCCLNPLGSGRGDAAKGRSGQGEGRGRGGLANVQLALAAAWSANPNNPPQYLDLPTKNGQAEPLVIAKWAANAPLVMVDQYAASLKRYHAIAADCGLQDGLLDSNQEMDRILTTLGVRHTFETYDGDHVNRVADRMEKNVLPFFSNQLAPR